MSSLTTPLPNEDGTPNVQTIVTCGGDDVSYQIPLSGPVMFYGTEFTSLYVTTNSVIAFGREDGTYSTWPSTPSISLFSMDWWAIPQQRPDEAFIISHSHVGFQVTLKVRPFGNNGTAPLTTIVFTASYNPDRTLNLSYYADNVDQYTTRTGVVLPNGTQQSFEQAGIVEEEEIPVVPGNPPSSETTTRDTDRTDEQSTEDTDRTDEQSTEDTDRETDSETTSRDTDREPDESEQGGGENSDIMDPIAPQLPVEPKPTEDPAVEPTPEPTPQKPSPQPTISPEKEPTPEPTPSEKPIEEPTENEPEPLPEPNETEAPEEPERELEVPELIANIPLLGNLAESLVNLLNDLNKVGLDMSPEVRERAQKIVVVSIIVTQIVGVSAAAAMASTSRRKN